MRRKRITGEMFLGLDEPDKPGWLGALLILAALGLSGALWWRALIVAVGP